MGPRWAPRGLLDRFWVDFGRLWEGFGKVLGKFGAILGLSAEPTLHFNDSLFMSGPPRCLAKHREASQSAVIPFEGCTGV